MHYIEYRLPVSKLRTVLYIACSPTPQVTWRKIGDESYGQRFYLESFGQQLTIDSVQWSDAGTYVCGGINDMAMNPIRRSFHLSVECKYGLYTYRQLVGWLSHSAH